MIADMIFEENASPNDFNLIEEIYEEEIIDEYGNRKVLFKTRMVKQKKNDLLVKMIESNKINGNPLDTVMEKISIKKVNDPDLAGAKDVYEELLDDGSRVQVIVRADGTIVKKIIKETEEEKRNNDLANLNKLKKETAMQEVHLQNKENEINKDKAELLVLEQQLQKLNKVETFKPPGVKGKILKRIVNEKGEEEFVEVELQGEDLDKIEIWEEVVDANGKVKRVKVSFETLKDIKN